MWESLPFSKWLYSSTRNDSVGEGIQLSQLYADSVMVEALVFHMRLSFIRGSKDLFRDWWYPSHAKPRSKSHLLPTVDSFHNDIFSSVISQHSCHDTQDLILFTLGMRCAVEESSSGCSSVNFMNQSLNQSINTHEMKPRRGKNKKQVLDRLIFCPRQTALLWTVIWDWDWDWDWD